METQTLLQNKAVVYDGQKGRLIVNDKLNALSPEARRLIEGLIEQLLDIQDDPKAQIDYESYILSWRSYFLRRGRSQASAYKYECIIRNLLRQIPQPTKVLLDTYLIMRHINGDGPSWLNSQIDAFRSFFGFLVRQNLIANNIAAGLDRLRIPQRERDIPAPMDIIKLLSIADAMGRACILLMLDCGLRISEVCLIRIADIDFHRRELHIIGKGNKERSVPVSDKTLEAIRDYLATRRGNAEYLFPARRRDGPATTQFINRLLANLCRQAGIKRITAHPLRHFCASAMLEDGASLKVVSQILGHSSPSTTATVYWHILEADAKRQQHKAHNPLKRLEAE